MTFDLEAVQQQLRAEGLDGWLLYVFRDQNPISVKVLNLPAHQVRTRRCFYWVPSSGEPVRLLHRIEPATLAHLPGRSFFYLSYQSLADSLAVLLADRDKVAMEYSPSASIPTVSTVDAGTVELVRGAGVEVKSSANLVQYFQARLSAEQVKGHFAAAAVCREAAHAAFAEVGRRLRAGESVRESEIQTFLMQRFADKGLITDHPPIVASGAHAGDPHYEPGKESDDRILKDQVLLIDLWAKLRKPGAVYADQTWMGFVGRHVPERVQQVWEIVRDARRASWRLIEERCERREPVYGWEGDQQARDHIEQAGFGDDFIHRTGHSIGEQDHGNGANLDNLETRELRRLLPGTLFSIEPGIYLPEFGVRSEFNVLIDDEYGVRVAEGTDQAELIMVDPD